MKNEHMRFTKSKRRHRAQAGTRRVMTIVQEGVRTTETLVLQGRLSFLVYTHRLL
jgi:hypothetical protein